MPKDKSWTQDELNEIADTLDGKAESVADGAYGNAEPGEDESWVGDLMHAAFLLREGRVGDLNGVEWDEIESCTEYNREDFEDDEQTRQSGNALGEVQGSPS